MVELAVSVTVTPEEAIVSVGGEVDAATSPQLAAELQRATAAGPRRVTVDLSAVSFIDSTGLGALVAALRHQREAGGDMWLRAPGASVRRVLEIAGLNQVFTIL